MTNISTNLPMSQNQMNANSSSNSLQDKMDVDANVQIVCYCIVFVIAVISDTLIFLVIGFDRKLHTKTNFLLLSLALTDWLIVAVGIPVNVANLKAGRSLTHGISCEITGFFILVPFIASNCNMALIAMHRYVLIVQNHKYKAICTRFNMGMSVFFMWVFVSLISAIPLFGWGRFSYNEDRAHCMVDWGYSRSYLVFLQIVAFPIPFFVMCVCYYKVISHTRASKKRLQASADRHNLTKKIRELRLTLMLLLVLVVFFTLDTPYAVLIYLEGFQLSKVPQAYSFAALLLAYSNSMFDFWIYAGISMKFRKACFRLMKKCLRKNERVRVHPITTDHTIPSDDSSDSKPEEKEKKADNESPVIVGNRGRGLSIASFFKKDPVVPKEERKNSGQVFIGQNLNFLAV